MSISGSGLEITGLRETIRDLEKYGAEVSDLKDAFRRIGTIVVDEAKRRAPKKSGALANSIRPSNTKNKSVVRVGSARILYAGPIHFGWPSRNIEANEFLYSAAEDTRDEVIAALQKELDQLARKLGL